MVSTLVTLVRIVRIVWAKITTASVNAGSQTFGKSCNRDALLGMTLTPGKTGIQSDNTSHKTVAVTNSGSVIAMTLNWLTTLLINVFGYRPSDRPTMIALGKAINAATKPMTAVFRMRGAMIRATSSSRLIE